MNYDFSFFLVLASFVTGVIWGGYLLFLKFSNLNPATKKEPLLVEYAHSFFPIFIIVLLLRSFVIEPFRIPSASMMPTLLIGDFILVNKFSYGIRLPVLHSKIIELNKPKRGDVAVFRYPKNPSVNYIKRIIGLPGDKIIYYNKKIIINGKPAKQVSLGYYQGVGQGKNMTGTERISEALPLVKHDILLQNEIASMKGVFVVPAGHYFVVGDNRDNSNDSRYWGTVPEENLLGKAVYIWMNWDWQHHGINFARIGMVIK